MSQVLDMTEEHHVTDTTTTDGKWQDAFNDDPELANSPVLAKYKTINAALKGNVDGEAYKGRSVAMVPPDASPEEKSDLVTKLRNNGVNVTYMPNPEDPEDMKRFWEEQGVPKDGAYTLPDGTDLAGLPQEGVDAAIQLSKELGHTAKQHEAFVASLNKYNVETNSSTALANTEMDEKLTKILGDARPALEGVLAEAITKHQHPDMPVEPFTAAQSIWAINLMKSVSVDPQSFDQINNPNTGPTPPEIRARQAEVWGILTKQNGRDLTKERKRVLNAEYKQTFADLAKFK